VELSNAGLERDESIGGGLDQDLMFLVLLDRSLPPVDRDHRGQDIYARREPFIDECLRDRDRVTLGSDRRQDDPDVEVGS